jgi:hypothetical protein
MTTKEFNAGRITAAVFTDLGTDAFYLECKGFNEHVEPSRIELVEDELGDLLHVISRAKHYRDQLREQRALSNQYHSDRRIERLIEKLTEGNL